MSGHTANPLDTFLREVAELSGMRPQPQRISEKEALICLEVYVETGKESCIKATEASPFEVDAAVKDLFKIIKEETLFTDPTFAFSLRLAYCNVVAEAIKEGKETESVFEARINETFPKELGERILEQFFENVRTDYAGGKEIVPTSEEIDKHFRERRKAIAPFAMQGRTATLRQNRNTGTNTWMEPCPDCGLEKRLDKRTKRFNCKKCDFDQPYPFKPAS